jgi:diacylglycerol kinase family enzyme
MIRLPLLFNLRSGTREKNPDALLGKLSPELRALIEPVPFGPPWDFEPWIAQAVRAEGPLLVWGGDGTIHHAGRALVAAGCPVPLGAIPGGSGNGLVRGLRTPLEPHGAVQRLLEGRELAMDLPRLDGEPFLNLCGTGFEAALAHAFHEGDQRGFLGYAQLGLGLWRHYPEFALVWDGETVDPPEALGRMDRLRAAWRGPEGHPPPKAWSLCCANLPQYGSGLWIAPGADPTDGLLQWATLRRPGLLDLVAELPQLFRENGQTTLRVEGQFPGASIQLQQAEPWHMDGEPAPARDRAELTVEPRAFRMQVTGACPWQ